MSNSHDYEAWVDGSFKKGLPSFGLMIYQLEEGESSLVYHDCGVLPADGSRQIAGEIEATILAIMWAREYHRKESNVKMKIYHDYMGLQAWPLRAWKANDRNAKRLVNIFDRAIAQGIEITFQHVKGHTGIQRNELVDKLAASAFDNI